MLVKDKKKPTWIDVKKRVAGMDSSDLIKLIKDLYSLSSETKNFLHASLDLGQDPLKPYKKIIDRSMYPNVMTNEPIRIKRAKQAIQDFKKANGNPKDVIDLMLFFVERGSQFTSDLGDIDEGFYYALENMYAKAIDTILSLPEKDILSFKDRLEDILDSTSGIGWGYHDELTHIYYEKFSDYCD